MKVREAEFPQVRPRRWESVDDQGRPCGHKHGTREVAEACAEKREIFYNADRKVALFLEKGELPKVML